MEQVDQASNSGILDYIFSLGGSLVIPFIIILLAIGFMVALKVAISRYRKVPPGTVGIFYGGKYKWESDGKVRGYMILSGGGRVQRPILEEYLQIPTTAFQVSIEEDNIPNKDNVKVSVKGVATCKVSSDPADLNKAIEALIDKLKVDKSGVSGEQEVQEFVLNILKGHLRSIIGKLDINSLLRERDSFNTQVAQESKDELKEFGMNLMNLVIQDIDDEEGYIQALGRQAVADAKADAEIKVAEAQRRQDIEVSNAQRDAAKTKAENEAVIAQAEKERDVKQAAYKQEADTKKAEAEMAFGIAQAAQEETLQVAQAKRDASTKEALIEVSKKEAERRSAELQATVVAQANADKEKSIIDAEADKQRRLINADAEAESLKLTAEAKRNAATLEGEGEANRIRAKLLAEAEGKAAEKRQALLAEAEGTERLAEALQKMDEKARSIIILDKLPLLFESGGDAGEKIMRAIFESVAAPLGNIDNISIVDLGGSNGTGGVNKIAEIGPKLVFDMFARAQALGIDITKVLSFLGINADQAQALLGGAAAEPAANGTHPVAAKAGSLAEKGVDKVLDVVAEKVTGQERVTDEQQEV